MRMMKRMLTVLFSMVLIFSLNISARAGEEARYTYMVRLFSGQQGTFENVDVTVLRGNQVITLKVEGGDSVTIKGLMYGDRITFDVSADSIDMSDDTKYYVKGIRESGKDNDTIEENSSRKLARASSGAATSFPVTGDADYVVGYGLLTDPITYTVNYVDAEGNALAPSRTYYGNVGDKPVVAYLYIDGYQPQAYNITGTLDRDSSKNVFTFVYTPVGRGENIYNLIVLPGTVIDLGTEVIIEGGGGAGGGAGAGGAGAGENIPDENIPLDGGTPTETEDIDDNELPLVNFVRDGVDNVVNVLSDAIMLFAGIPVAAGVGIAIAFTSAIGMGIWGVAYFKERKKKKEDE